MQFYLNGYKPGDPFIEDPHPSVGKRPKGLPEDADVLIVGYGPVGQVIAAMLARHGHRVAAYERFAEIYRLPRAVYFDDEIMQVWQSLGIADELAGELLPASSYNWFGADGELIMKMEFPSPGRSGWH